MTQAGGVDITKVEGRVETLVTLAFLSFFFLYLLRLLNVINQPFKVGHQRGDDDVSLVLPDEFVVHARLGGHDLTSEQVVEIAERIEAEETATTDESDDPTQEPPSSSAPGASTPGS